jgi:hypothetical protein
MARSEMSLRDEQMVMAYYAQKKNQAGLWDGKSFLELAKDCL